MNCRYLIVLLLVAIGVGNVVACGADPVEPQAAQPTPDKAQAEDANAKSADKGPEPFTLKGPIARQREKLRNAPGRTGILAETKRYSLFDEELVIRDFFQDREGGFFVDVGCAWPGKANNTYYLEEHLGWTGIGIDALDDYASAWERLRPASKFFSYLVTDHSGTIEAFYKSESVGLSSAVRKNADGKSFGGKLKVEEISTPTITLNELLTREGVDKIDLLAMDIEGFEMTALRGFDITRFAPDLVVVEGKDPEVAAYFNEHGYEVIQRYLAFDLINKYFRRSIKQPSSNHQK